MKILRLDRGGLHLNDDGVAALEALTPAEQELLGAILAGRRAELGGQTIRAAVLRDFSVGSRPEWQVPPVGISLNNGSSRGDSILKAAPSTSR